MVGLIAPHVLNIPRFLDSAIDSIPKTLYGVQKTHPPPIGRYTETTPCSPSITNILK